MKRILLFTILCASSLALESQTITWTGAGDCTNWSDSNNWDLFCLPNESHDVIMPNESTVIIDVVASCNSIEVQGESTLTINSGLSINGSSLFSENATVNWQY